MSLRKQTAQRLISDAGGAAAQSDRMKLSLNKWVMLGTAGQPMVLYLLNVGHY